MIPILSLFTFISSVFIFVIAIKMVLKFFREKDWRVIKLALAYFFIASGFLIYGLQGIIVFSPESIIAAQILVFIPLTVGFTILADIVLELIHSHYARVAIWFIGDVSLMFSLLGFAMFSHIYSPIQLGNFLIHRLQPTDFGQVIAASGFLLILLFPVPILLSHSLRTIGVAKKRGLILVLGNVGGVIADFNAFIAPNFIESNNYALIAIIIGVISGVAAAIVSFIGFVMIKREGETNIQ